MKEIQGDAKTIQSVLGNRKFGIDYYQREYRWAEKHVHDLIEDLTESFFEHYDSMDEPPSYKDYGRYFLGSIIINNKDKRQYIVDGQQRLTTLTLLLIHLCKSIEDKDYTEMIGDCIYSFDGVRSYNLSIDAREKCMDHLFKGAKLNQDLEEDQSVVTILQRFNDIHASLSDAMNREEVSDQDHAYKLFALWLLNNVYLVEIVADNESDAYAIFETMNDRGMRLTPTEMLRGHLLAQINDSDLRNRTALVWDDRVRSLGKDQESDAIKTWLRSQHAMGIRERRRNAVPRDFERIGSEFHRWVRDSSKQLGLAKSSEYAEFIARDFKFYAQWYQRIWEASNQLRPDLKPFFYVGRTGFTLHYLVALASLQLHDNEHDCLRKLNAVATFVDCMLHRRVWNRRSNTRNTLEFRMFRSVTLGIRGKSVDELPKALCTLLDGFGDDFSDANFGLHGRNGPAVHEILARLTDYVETESGLKSSYERYQSRSGRGRYQIEHVLSKSHEDDPGLDDFDYHRNKIGALVLLPGHINPALGAMRFEQKREHYLKQNLLASSFHDLAYERDSQFRRLRESGVDFKPYETFNVDAINERQELYRQLAERIWSTDSIWQAAGLTPPASSTDPSA